MGLIMLKTLDKILLSDNVVKEFYNNYNNLEFKNYLLKVLPEIEDCKNLKQDNPWHIYNCLDHILHSVENINQQTRRLDFKTRRMLAYTMFLHDVGKPECYIRRFSKLYNKEIDSFFNHNLASEKIAARVLPEFNFNKNEQQLIKLLVREHDIFINIKLTKTQDKHQQLLSNKLLNSYIKQYNKIGDGQQIMDYLIMIGRADNLAQNPEKTKEPLYMLDVMQDMLNNQNNLTLAKK